MYCKLEFKDFIPSKWKIKNNKLITDQSTGKDYLHQSEKNIREKCLLLTVATIIFHPIVGLLSVFFGIALGVFPRKVDNNSYMNSDVSFLQPTLQARVFQVIKSILKPISLPFLIVCLELAAIYGVYDPLNGRKIYAAFERLYYDFSFGIAPCFQPRATSHAFGGSLDDPDAW